MNREAGGKRCRLQRRLATVAAYVALGGLSLVFLMPFLWMVSASFKDLQGVYEYPPSFLPTETLTVERDGKRLKLADCREADGEVRRVVILDRRQDQFLVEDTEPVARTALAAPAGSPAQAVIPASTARWVPEESVSLVRRVRFRTENYPVAWTTVPFSQFLANTVVITVFAIVGQVLSASLVAFSFARLDWPGKRPLFLVVLATMMLPGEVTLIPNYLIFRTLGWIDTFLPLIVPSFLGGGAFFIFLFRQFFMTIPRELDEAARVDGCSSLRIWWDVLMPLCKPIIATIVVLSFVNHWNDFLTPLIYLNTSERFTLAVGLRFFQGAHETDMHLLMAAATLVLIPVVLVFLLGQRYFVKSIVLSGTKG